MSLYYKLNDYSTEKPIFSDSQAGFRKRLFNLRQYFHYKVTYRHIEIKKQVAQRATIAHLSPMCQGQSAPKPYAAFPPTQ